MDSHIQAPPDSSEADREAGNRMTRLGDHGSLRRTSLRAVPRARSSSPMDGSMCLHEDVTQNRRATAMLRDWLYQHFLHPYPSNADKQKLSRATQLTRTQVSHLLHWVEWTKQGLLWLYTKEHFMLFVCHV